MGMFIILGLLVLAIVVNLAGPHGEGALGARESSWLLTLLLFVAMLAVAGRAVCARWDGIFIDRDNRISLARFQLICWTILIISAFFTAGLTNLFAEKAAALAISVPETIWALLGLGSFTAVAAPAIKEAQKRVRFQNPPAAKAAGLAGPASIAGRIKAVQGLKDEGRFVNRVYVNENPADARWINMISGDYEGAEHVDVSKLQQLVFTMVLVSAYGFALWAAMKQPGSFKDFPEPHPSFLALLGISHAAYLADKQVSNT